MLQVIKCKRIIIEVLRNIHLLQFTDYLFFIINVIKNRGSNKNFLTKHEDFAVPPAYLAYDAYNHTNNEIYLNMGMRHASFIKSLVSEYITSPKIRICEWGCGPARVIRHLSKINSFQTINLFGTDYNADAIKWCKNNIENINFCNNNLEPPLAFESETFDCVYAVSIFTHLSEKMHHAWVDELFRVLKPGGILIFTTHGDICSRKLLPHEKEKYDAGDLVIRDRIKEGKKHFAAFHPPQYIKNTLLKDYIILKHINDARAYQLEQDIWVASKSP